MPRRLDTKRQARLADAGGVVGFGGFRVYPEISGEAEVIVAIAERAARRGYGGEATRALLRHAHRDAGQAVVHAAADEPNVASIRMLTAAGFVPAGSVPGAFGRIVLFQHREAGCRAPSS